MCFFPSPFPLNIKIVLSSSLKKNCFSNDIVVVVIINNDNTSNSNNNNPMITFLLDPFLGLGCHCGESHKMLLLTVCLLLSLCFLVQFNCEYPRDRVYYSSWESYQGEISESNQSTLSTIFPFLPLLQCLFYFLNFSLYCSHARLLVRN